MINKIILFLLLLTNLSYSQDYEIDEYTFTWLVDEVRNVKLEIKKEEDRVQVVLGYDMKWLHLTPSNAENIGKVLSQTNDYYNKMKDSSGELKEKVSAGDYFVQFNQSEQYGFKVYIAKEGDFYLDFVIERKAALGLSEYLMESKAMVAYLNEQLEL